jgi:hypothetical protein
MQQQMAELNLKKNDSMQKLNVIQQKIDALNHEKTNMQQEMDELK